MMQVQGTSILPQIAIGKIRFLQVQPQRHAEYGESPEKERERFVRAREAAGARLTKLYEKACQEAGADEAEILEVHRMLLEDEDFADAVEAGLEAGYSAEAAVMQAGEQIAALFRTMDAYMRARAADILDVAQSLVRALSGAAEAALEEPAIVMAEDLAPSTTVQLDKQFLLGFVTSGGSANSHTAILSRTMSIPALIQTPIDPAWDGKQAILDGRTGTLYIEPEEATCQQLSAARDQLLAEREALCALRGLPAQTSSGQRVLTYANVGSISDVELAVKNDADGIGLFRSEFLFLGREDYPTEQEQYDVYCRILELMQGKRVIVRTMDIGADKKIGYFQLDEEENPALGLRGIRLCLERREVFRTQLRALLRAAAKGRLSVMYPMITSAEEILEVRTLVQAVYEELCTQKIECALPEQGIMIETPAAAIIADELAPMVDFFSIGTNDLIQYTLAADRQNARLGRFCDPYHPAVRRLIRGVVEAAHQAGIWAGICGELAADPVMTQSFVELGIDELSVSPGAVLPLRAAVRAL